MANFLSGFSLSQANNKRAKTASKNTVWRDERDPRIFYRLRPRAKKIVIKVDAARREITAVVPEKESNLNAAKAFVNAKWDWVVFQLETLPKAQPFVPRGTILFHGKTYALICPEKRGRATIDHDTRDIFVPGDMDTFEGRTKRFLIRQAREALTQCSRVHADTLGRKIKSISVRDTASRWGSCKKGNVQQGGTISYSWRLICAPPFVLDYVCAHECAHLIEGNHGKGFWALCDSLVDTVRPAKRWLRENGDMLHAIGARA
ncbi:MAG: SprT family zinc-dependent metalloprotease [Robiginitomaculum sp.]